MTAVSPVWRGPRNNQLKIREVLEKELEQLYREGKMNPEEYRIIEELLNKEQ